MSKKTENKDGYPFVLFEHEGYSADMMIERSAAFYQWMNKRRSVRDFASTPIPKEVIENIILTASTAPSGAHKQPWSFCLITDPDLKTRIRVAAEKEERESYAHRMNASWLEALRPLQTDWHKPFLEIAPYLIVVFKKVYDILPDGTKQNNYYVNESVGMASGMLLAAIHSAGLVALTHTPSPMDFLSTILGRPANERPFLVIPVGYPAAETYVPDIKRKPLEDISTFY